MKNTEYLKKISAYSPWLDTPDFSFENLPAFKRPMFHTLKKELNETRQILALIGPRRVGKTTILQQLISEYLKSGIAPRNLIYYSFDDPSLLQKKENIPAFVEWLFESAHTTEGIVYLFLDEIQRLDYWELYLKKYYDLKYKVRIIISGSASSPIFKKSHESLLGRITQHYLYPFSFSEYVDFQLQDDDRLSAIRAFKSVWKDIFRTNILGTDSNPEALTNLSYPGKDIQELLSALLEKFFIDGGYPEVWRMSDFAQKQKYLYDNQIEKVIFEDLVLAAEFRKPERLKEFYLSLLNDPGREASELGIAQETGIAREQIRKYFPLLELTHLVFRLTKFRKNSGKVRMGKTKFYLVDLALRNTLMKITDFDELPGQMLGKYAENLVFMTLYRQQGILSLDYYREKNDEVDFIAQVIPGLYLPIEVKFANKVKDSDFKQVKRFRELYNTNFGMVITKHLIEPLKVNEGIYSIPLSLFLLLD